MKKTICIMILTALALAVFAGCAGNKAPDPFDPDAAFGKIISEVKFAGDLRDQAEYAEFVFGDAMNGGEVRMYEAGDKLADAAMFFKVNDKADLEAVKAAVDEYLASRKLEADRYNPAESAKIDKAVVWSDDTHMIVCITDDTDTVNKILNNK